MSDSTEQAKVVAPTTEQTPAEGHQPWLEELTPRQIVAELDRYIVGQDDAKKAVAIAIRTRWSQQVEKDVTSNQAAKLASQIGATGAVVTWDAGGNDFMEVIRTVQACEKMGINTVFLTTEEHPDTGSPLLEPLPEARAIVTTG